MILDPVRGKVLDITSKENRSVVNTADGLEHSADLVVVAGELSREHQVHNTTLDPWLIIL